MKTDEELKKDVVDHLYWNSSVDASKINVTVEDGDVTLSGEVPTYAEMSAARAAAWNIEGVFDVIDEMVVSHVTPPPLPTDSEIKTRVENSLSWDPSVDDSEITVSVVDGTVTLEGTVDRYWKRSHTENRVSGIRGVIGIENKLAVVPSKTIGDELIAEDVVDAIDRDTRLDVEDVTVKVDNGVVTLTGTVPSTFARNAARWDASRTAGVTGVKNKLNIGTYSRT